MQMSMNDGAADNHKNRLIIVDRLKAAPPDKLPPAVATAIKSWTHTSLDLADVQKVRKQLHGDDTVLWLVRNLLISLEDLLSDKEKRMSWEPTQKL